MELPTLASGGDTVESGLMYFCCTPCFCDTEDFIKIDTKTVRLASGVEKVYKFGTIGNVCNAPGKLSEEHVSPFNGQKYTLSGGNNPRAPELICEDNCQLKGATLSDNGGVIIGMFFEDDGSPTNNANLPENYCSDRAASGYNSGMGTIFRKAAEIGESEATCVAGADRTVGVDTCGFPNDSHGLQTPTSTPEQAIGTGKQTDLKADNNAASGVDPHLLSPAAAVVLGLVLLLARPGGFPPPQGPHAYGA